MDEGFNKFRIFLGFPSSTHISLFVGKPEHKNDTYKPFGLIHLSAC